MTPYDILVGRRSVVAAKMIEPGPDDETLAKIVEVGLRVPDHGKFGPWRIQIIKKEAQAVLGDLYAALYAAENSDAQEGIFEFQRNLPMRAPVMLVVTSHYNHEKLAKVPLIEQTLSGGAVCQNLLNGAHALGFVAQWITEWPAYSVDVKKALGHDADTDILGFIFIGSGDVDNPPKVRDRATAEMVVSEWSGN